MTGKLMELVYEPDTTIYRGDVFKYVHLAYRDPDSGDQWTTDELDESNTNQVYNQYRIKHGIPFPADIAAMRKHYDVSALMMSRIMGFGVNQWRKYEDGEIPNESNARAIIAAADVNTFLRFLDMASADIDGDKREKIKAKAMQAGSYNLSHPSAHTGYTSFSQTKCSAVVREVISRLGETFITKANKLLFYIDFLYYKRTGFSMTGLEYQAMQYGPIPRDYMAVYGSLKGVGKEERMIGSAGGTVLVALEDYDNPYKLTQSELDCIADVCEKFNDTTCAGISEYSHREEAWRNYQEQRATIPYSESFSLSMN